MSVSRVVSAPDGRVWMVERRWVREPRHRWLTLPDEAYAAVDALLNRRWWAGKDARVADGFDLAAAAFLIVPILLPVLMLAWIFLNVLAAVFRVLRYGVGWVITLALRRPFTVVASDGATTYEWQARGWRASGRIARAVADAIERGASVGAAAAAASDSVLAERRVAGPFPPRATARKSAKKRATLV